MRCLELYCGIGGFAVAAQRLGWDVEVAIDIDQRAAEIYRRNFEHTHAIRTIESLSARWLAEVGAELWWMSPPCQPFTRRGRHRDDQDPRTHSFLHLLQCLEDAGPSHLALENVPEFRTSRTASRLRAVLEKIGYQWQEIEVCPTSFGIPNRRRRFYLVASRTQMIPRIPVHDRSMTLASILDDSVDRRLWVEDLLLDRYRDALHVVAPGDAQATANCFTSAYGKSPVKSGSYLVESGGVRRFSPREILRLLGFPESFELPGSYPLRTLWKLIGNSLSIHVVEQAVGVLDRSVLPSASS